MKKEATQYDAEMGLERSFIDRSYRISRSSQKGKMAPLLHLLLLCTLLAQTYHLAELIH